MPYPSYDRKKIAIEISSWVLAISASMILGLLSFSGMLTIWPVLTFAFAAFIFAIIIEGEIYLQSIRSALEKLTDPKAYEHQLIGLYLQEKLSAYDTNRDLLLMREPNPEDIRRILTYNQVIFFQQNGLFKIGFRNAKNNEYESRELTEEQCRFLNHYSPQDQYLEIPGHHEHIQKLLQTFHPNITSRPQTHYPLFIRAYVSQCEYVRRLNCYVHSQTYHPKDYEDLQNMNDHLTHLDNEMSDYLFHDTPLTEMANELSIQVPSIKNKENQYQINLSQMTAKLSNSSIGSFATKKPKFSLNNDGTIQFEPSLWEAFRDLSDDDAMLATISQKTYDFHRNELIKWMMNDRAEWKKRLSVHTMYSRLALVISSFSGLIMGIGTTYLIMEAVVSIPWLAAIPLTVFPPIIAPLALLAGIAYGLLIYNSLTDMLLDDPFTKFVNRIRSISWQNMNFKRGLVLGLTALLFVVTVFLTVCTAGTWLTVFHKTKPLFQWLNIIPNVLLNIVIPILIGISILPFSILSITNTLENLETNPKIDQAIAALNFRNWQSFRRNMPSTWSEASTQLSDSFWQRWVPRFLGITAEEFAQETRMQKWNPWRIAYRLFFEPLRYFIFIGHLISAGATSDQIEGVPLMYSFWLNFGFECAEDWDWIWGRTHVDSIDTVDLLKERVQNSDDHNHDKNFPMRVLKFLFEPIIQRAAKWDNHYCKKYELALMSEIKKDENRAEPYKIYLADDGSYVVQDRFDHEKLHRGKLPPSIKLDNLQSRLTDPDLKQAILEVTSNRDQTHWGDNVQKRYEKLQGMKTQASKPDIPEYRKASNYNLFLFKSSVYESSLSLSDTCCIRI